MNDVVRWAVEATIVGAIAVIVSFLPRFSSRFRHAILVIAMLKFAIPSFVLVVPLVRRYTYVTADSVVPAEFPWELVVYGAGAAVAAVTTIVRWWRIQRIANECVVADHGRVHGLFVEVTKELGLRRVPRLLVSDRDESPISLGLLRPAVLIPRSLLETEERVLRVVFGHELIHHLRRDLWIAYAQAVLGVVWWFQPLFHILGRRIDRLREDACDDALLAHGIATDESYCAVLLDVARQMTSRPFAVAAAPMADGRPIQQRIIRIMSTDPGAARLPQTARFAFALVAFAVLPGFVVSETRVVTPYRAAVQAVVRQSPALPSSLPRPRRSPPRSRPRLTVKSYKIDVAAASDTASNDGGDAAAIDTAVEDIIERPAAREKTVQPKPAKQAEKPLTKSERFFRAVRRTFGFSDSPSPSPSSSPSSSPSPSPSPSPNGQRKH